MHFLLIEFYCLNYTYNHCLRTLFIVIYFISISEEGVVLFLKVHSCSTLTICCACAGTYHVRYDEENLELLKASLNSSLEDIPALNRFQLVLDYGMFALAGLEPLSEV